MSFIVCKFGGTSVSSSENWHNIAAICRQHITQDNQIIVVCLAYSQTSNLLEKAIQAALIGQYQPINEGDVILIANTGAYGHCMGSAYNLRPPSDELIL